MILLSFDTEEIDVPHEHGVVLFFCTGHFAECASAVMQRQLYQEVRRPLYNIETVL